MVSEATVVIKSSIGRLYKSNVTRLRPWKGRESAHVMGELGIEGLLPEIPVLLSVIPIHKKGPGRPKKLLGKTVQKVVKATTKTVTKKVSTGEGLRGKRVKRLTKSLPVVAFPEARLLKIRAGVRRSPRLAGRAAVT